MWRVRVLTAIRSLVVLDGHSQNVPCPTCTSFGVCERLGLADEAMIEADAATVGRRTTTTSARTAAKNGGRLRERQFSNASPQDD